MSNELSFQYVMNRILKNISDDFDKRETSLIYQSAAMVVPELMLIKSEIELLEDEAFPDTCSYKNLVRFSKLRGIEPKPETYGMVTAEFNIEIPIDTRFNCEKRNYRVSEYIEDKDDVKIYKMLAEEPGHIETIGELTPIDDIPGLSVARITKINTDGSEEESIESLRARYNASLEYQAFGGNRADYIDKVLTIDNVGACKVIRRPNATSSEVGHISIYVLDSTFKDSPQDLINTVQEIMAPLDSNSGVGLAPIGHMVVVKGVKKKNITVTTNLVLEDNRDDLTNDITNKIEEYIQNLRYGFGNDSSIIVRLSRIENALLDVPGVIDVSQTKINGLEKNIVIDDDSIPILEGVTYNVG